MKIPMLFLFIREILLGLYDEIEQLLNDVADAFQENRDNYYYIGTLVVNKENGIFKIIDGQQRTTALNLIALAFEA